MMRLCEYQNKIIKKKINKIKLEINQNLRLFLCFKIYFKINDKLFVNKSNKKREREIKK
jgi:hypothetical protein